MVRHSALGHTTAPIKDFTGDEWMGENNPWKNSSSAKQVLIFLCNDIIMGQQDHVTGKSDGTKFKGIYTLY